jgi:small GTP-binding protein
MLDSWINFGDGFLLVFAINDEESFKLLEQKRARIIKNKNNNNIPIILVGNKQDLNDERKVEFSDAKNLADSWKCEYIETSATKNFRCKEAFEKLAAKIVETQNTKTKSKNCPCCLIF